LQPLHVGQICEEELGKSFDLVVAEIQIFERVQPSEERLRNDLDAVSGHVHNNKLDVSFEEVRRQLPDPVVRHVKSLQISQLHQQITWDIFNFVLVQPPEKHLLNKFVTSVALTSIASCPNRRICRPAGGPARCQRGRVLSDATASERRSCSRWSIR
jgi:hypothetical protein